MKGAQGGAAVVTQRPSAREGKNHPTSGEGRKASQRDAEGSRTGPPRPLGFLTEGREWSLSPGMALRGSCQGPGHSLEAAASSYWPRSRGLERWEEHPIPAAGPPAGLTKGGLCADDSSSVAPLLLPASRASASQERCARRVLSLVPCAARQDSALHPSCAKP